MRSSRRLLVLGFYRTPSRIVSLGEFAIAINGLNIYLLPKYVLQARHFRAPRGRPKRECPEYSDESNFNNTTFGMRYIFEASVSIGLVFAP